MNNSPSEQRADADGGSSSRDMGGRGPSLGGSKAILLGVVVLAGTYWLVNRERTAPPAGAPVVPSVVPWVEDYHAGVALAGRKHQPILLAFKATWCGPCKWMDREVFSKPATAKLLSGWVPVHLDVDQSPELARKYEIRGVPTFIVLSSTGQEIDRADGALTLEELTSFLASAQAKMARAG